MKKITRILLVALLLSLFTSFTYAGLGDEPRPDSIKPIAIEQTVAY